MGPLYHLVFEEDRRQAVRQAADRLRSGGLLFSTHLSRLGILGDLMRRMPEWIERGEEVRSLLSRGRRPWGDYSDRLLVPRFLSEWEGEPER